MLWKKLLRHPSVLSSLTFHFFLTLPVLGLWFRRPEIRHEFSLWIFFSGILYIIGSITWLSARLLKGSVTVQRFTKLFYYWSGYPASAFYGYVAAAIPEYAILGVGTQFASALILIGIYEWKRFWTGATIFVLSMYACAFAIRGPGWILGTIERDLILVGTWIFFAIMLVRHSLLFLKQDESLRKLLRGIRKDKRAIAEERAKSDRLLLNILPETVAEELKRRGTTEPVSYAGATVLFTDFQGFTSIAERLKPQDLVAELDRCFSYFDSLMPRFHLEKLKTIGDSYMCVGGLPIPNQSHAIDAALAALEIQAFMNQMKSIKADQGLPYWELRVGIHSGPLVAGVIGERKFAYDVWGDTVNTASRMESSGVTGRVNISRATFDLISAYFECEFRGRVQAKNKGDVEMYFINRIKPEFSRDSEGKIPNERFIAARSTL
ncbi:MAG: adenylate/guanylate cyclase domain-containing protein [Spirochaetia bacterium]|nr:adenylate/guanylate cyclase domain-containing protein [Spirochaetia bacterium]